MIVLIDGKFVLISEQNDCTDTDIFDDLDEDASDEIYNCD